MANHMETIITVVNGDSKVAEKLKEIFTPKEGEYEVNTQDLAERIFTDEAPEEYDYGWSCDTLGAKWIYSEFYLEDDDTDYVDLKLTSAWSVPQGLLEKLAEVLSDIKEDCYICGTYEDESMDPCGGFIYAKNYDDIEDIDEEYDWGKEEEDDFYRENFHEKVYNLKEDMVKAYLEFKKEEE